MGQSILTKLSTQRISDIHTVIKLLIQEIDTLETVYVSGYKQSRSVLPNTDYTLESGVYKGNFFFIIIGTDYEHLFSMNNSLNPGINMEFYEIGESVPYIEIEFPEEFTPDCYFNLSTIKDLHNVPIEFMQDSKELYDILERTIGRKDDIR